MTKVIEKSNSTGLGLLFIERISPTSEEYHNCGYAPSIALYRKHYIDAFTSERITITDLDEKLERRNSSLSFFFDYYVPLFFDKHEITIFSIVVSQKSNPNISSFLRNFSDRIARNGAKVLGYIWVRDYGSHFGGKHFHLLLATTKMNEDQIKKFITPNISLKQKSQYDYKIQLLETRYGMFEYLKVKGVYAGAKQKSYGRSKFEYPKQINTN